MHVGDKFIWSGRVLQVLDRKDNGVHHDLNRRTWAITAEQLCAPYELENSEVFNHLWI